MFNSIFAVFHLFICIFYASKFQKQFFLFYFNFFAFSQYNSFELFIIFTLVPAIFATAAPPFFPAATPVLEKYRADAHTPAGSARENIAAAKCAATEHPIVPWLLAAPEIQRRVPPYMPLQASVPVSCRPLRFRAVTNPAAAVRSRKPQFLPAKPPANWQSREWSAVWTAFDAAFPAPCARDSPVL